jgi:arginyl-tRNA--protein-N-Asp/Glu arginylyltransferase
LPASFFLGVVGRPSRVVSITTSTALAAFIDEKDMSADQLEIEKIRQKWNAVRHMSTEEANSTLDKEWKAAYNRYYEKYDKDMQNMEEIVSKLKTMIEPPKVEKKTNGQRKRDKWAKVQGRVASRAAAVAALTPNKK